MNEFKCYKCGRQSRYRHRVGIDRYELMSFGSGRHDTRTYECEQCGAENEITNSQSGWMAIDLGEREA
jgi:hypothetical protein